MELTDMEKATSDFFMSVSPSTTFQFRLKQDKKQTTDMKPYT